MTEAGLCVGGGLSQPDQLVSLTCVLLAAAVRSEWWVGLEFYFQTSHSLLKLQDVQCE